MLIRKNKIVILSLAPLFLSGCTTIKNLNPFAEDAPQFVEPRKYDDNLSFANNVAREMGLMYLEDVNVPEDKYDGGAIKLSELDKKLITKNIPGQYPENWWSWDAGYTFGKALLTPRPAEKDNHILFYLPRRYYKTSDVAEHAFAKILGYRLKKATKSLGFSSYGEVAPKTKKFTLSETTVIKDTIVAPSVGCPRPSEVKGPLCEATIIFERSKAVLTQTPQWISKKEEKAWKFTPKVQFVFKTPLGAKISKEDYFKAFQSVMPSTMLFYFAPIESKTKLSAPYVVNNEGFNYFIVPMVRNLNQ